MKASSTRSSTGGAAPGTASAAVAARLLPPHLIQQPGEVAALLPQVAVEGPAGQPEAVADHSERRSLLQAFLPERLTDEIEHAIPVAGARAQQGHLPVYLPQQQGLQGEVAAQVGEIEQGRGEAQLEPLAPQQAGAQPGRQVAPERRPDEGGQHQLALPRVIELEQGIEIAQIRQAAHGDDVRVIGFRVVTQPRLTIFLPQHYPVALADEGAKGEEEVQRLAQGGGVAAEACERQKVGEQAGERGGRPPVVAVHMGGGPGQQPEVALGVDPPLGVQQLFSGNPGTLQELGRISSLSLPVGEAVQGNPVGDGFHGKNPCRRWPSIIRQRRWIAVSQRRFYVSDL